MDVEPLTALKARVAEQVGKVVVGQHEAVELMLVALLADGHILLEGVPGDGQDAAGAQLRRDAGAGLRPHPVHARSDAGRHHRRQHLQLPDQQLRADARADLRELLLADEINRTPPKTQAALLEAMQERSVTIDGHGHPLGPPLHGDRDPEPDRAAGHLSVARGAARPLPVQAPARLSQRARRSWRSSRATARRTACVDPESAGVDRRGRCRATLARLTAIVAEVRLNDEIVAYVVDLVRATREHTGAAVRRLAARRGDAGRARRARWRPSRAATIVIPDDVKRWRLPALRHRVVLSPSARSRASDVDGVLGQIIDRQAAPR